MTDAVTYEQDGGVVTLTLNEPDTRNALSPEIIDAIVAHVARINADLSVGCVILTGAGEGFSSGGNVKKMKDRATDDRPKTPTEVRRYYHEGIQRIPLALYNLEAPSIAAVNGAAIGAGLDLATMCDIRIAARSAKRPMRPIPLMPTFMLTSSARSASQSHHVSTILEVSGCPMTDG